MGPDRMTSTRVQTKLRGNVSYLRVLSQPKWGEGLPLGRASFPALNASMLNSSSNFLEDDSFSLPPRSAPP